MENTVGVEVQADEALFLVLDIPVTATAEEAAHLLNDSCTRGFYVLSVLECPGAGARAFLRRRVKPLGETKPEVPKVSREAVAMQFLRDNREMSIPQLYAAFKALGFTRGAEWLKDKRDAVIRLDRRVS